VRQEAELVVDGHADPRAPRIERANAANTTDAVLRSGHCAAISAAGAFLPATRA
jgi:hypothetical protein